ncbi:hypothetical protein L3V83_03250 [Thiotrichales bacterium 19X7-9]|nr:hypothetical protein [Thiotrichales bacterium 19X7-9]
MSNPAVITLDGNYSRKGKFKRFVIEDNIGESLHLHIDNMRIDFTINEYLEFANMIRSSLKNLDFLKGINFENIDVHFLKESAYLLDKLIKIDIETVNLNELKCIVHSHYSSSFNLMKLLPIKEIPAYKYLQGDKTAFLNYDQYNYYHMNNEARLLGLLDSIRQDGYPKDERYIITFDGQNIIRDGQHRAAVLAYLYGLEYQVKVMKFRFMDRSHFIRINQANFKMLVKAFLKICYRKIRKYRKK